MKAKASSFRPSNLAAVCIGAACAFVFCFDCLELAVARRKFRRKATGSRCASLPLLAGRIWEIGFRETVCPWDALYNCTLPCHGHEDEHGYVRPSQETDKFCRLRAALDYTCSGEDRGTPSSPWKTKEDKSRPWWDYVQSGNGLRVIPFRVGSPKRTQLGERRLIILFSRHT